MIHNNFRETKSMKFATKEQTCFFLYLVSISSDVLSAFRTVYHV